jgi:alpha-L-rhamnosidase
MKPTSVALVFIYMLLMVKPASAQSAGGEPYKPWNAFWINARGETGRDYGVFYFRKQLD